MKTLVIHPADPTTDFLKAIYADKKDWTVLNTFHRGKHALAKEIESHDRIIMLGHGTEDGLIGGMGFIINSKLVYLLREKRCVCIWCNADVFVRNYKLKGFYTGMIISEYEEALLYSMQDFSYGDISTSNILFSDSVKKAISDEDTMLQVMVDSYKSDTNPITKFNQQNLYFNK